MIDLKGKLTEDEARELIKCITCKPFIIPKETKPYEEIEILTDATLKLWKESGYIKETDYVREFTKVYTELKDSFFATGELSNEVNKAIRELYSIGLKAIDQTYKEGKHEKEK